MSSLIPFNIIDKVKSAFNFSVEKRPLHGPNAEETGIFGLFRSDNGQFIGSSSVTERYTPHETDDVIALVEAASVLFDGAIDVRCNFKDGHYVIVQPTKDYRVSVFGSDTIWPSLMINASYDKRAALIGMAMNRDMCKNMHIPRQVEGTTESLRHTSGLRPKMDELIEQFSTLEDGWKNYLIAVREMKETKTSVVKFLEEIYGERPQDTGNSQTRFDNTIRSIVQRVAKEQAKVGQTFNGEVSVWQAFNGVQGFVQHESTRKGMGKVIDVEFTRIIAVNDDTKVSDAEKLALKLIGF